ncbi:DUF5696 domain-containing protein [Paenibacillus spongiae]|uniref:DUF5696 domain-containing protein n=1 Tax=Paenibacillus spongiae TaxID=2909671 RepID=A0ABY5SDY1_9BACL|nr:DUF5696 domain-containing protein [Paenibacillus spongiae]UVI31984.1 DUF5696 domain-containing protein [Paenibacillus spongiae]
MRIGLKRMLSAASACLAVIAAVSLLAPVSDRTIEAEAEWKPVRTEAAASASAERPDEEAMQSVSELGVIPPQRMELADENGQLALYLNRSSAEIAVYDKRSKHFWYSNPQDTELDSKASPFEKESLGSQFTLTYMNSIGNKKTLLSFNDSVKNNQFQIEDAPEGIRIVYTLGDTSKGIDVLPKLISKERLDQFMAKADEAKAKYVYRKYELQDNGSVYERFDQSINSEIVLKRVVDAFEQAGYTPDDLAADNKENGIEGSGEGDKPVFTVPVEYRLDGGHLVVAIDSEQMMEPGNNVITEIALLKYFGAAGVSERGYMLVPDGSGSLIHLNNGKFNDDIYSQPVYGSDEAIRKRFKEQNSEVARLPVFGLKAGDYGMYGIIENGAAAANVNAEVSGRTNSYNYVYGSFNIRNFDELPLSNGQSFDYVTIMQSRRIHGQLSVRYGFLSGMDAGYDGMARAYQNYLVRTYDMKQLEGQGNIPFFLDLTGTIPKRQSFLGIPYEVDKPLTTFRQARQILQEMKEGGIGNIKLRYAGWFNDGVNHTLPTTVKVDRELGGQSGLRELATYMEENEMDFYPDAAFLRVYHDTRGFSPSKDASRYITRNVIQSYPYDLSSLRLNPALGSYYLLSPSRLPAYVDQFLKHYNRLGIEGLSLRDMGAELNPDYRDEEVIDRQQSAIINADQLKKISPQVPDLLVAGGNAYALPYIRNVVDAPLTDSRFNITDEAVPFYQMVVHGFVSYAGKPFNLADDQDMKLNMLKAIEYGANVRFSWMFDEPSAVKDTRFNTLYSAHYKTWLEEAKTVYGKVNDALKGVQYERMTGHRKVKEGVYVTTYENNKAVIVNYTDRPVTVDGISVDAHNYAVGG